MIFYFKLNWYKNGKPLPASSRINSAYDFLTGVATLKIPDAMTHDAGVYEVIAENDAGSDRSMAKVNVNPSSGIDKAPIFEQPSQPVIIERPKPPPLKLEPPRVVIPLIDTRLTEGASVQLVSKITGTPEPKVRFSIMN